MERVLGLDFGTVRTGVAISDPLGITAQPVGTFESKDRPALVEKIAQVCVERSVKKVVMGLPINMNGSEGESAQKVRDFAKALEERIPGVEVILRDERLSTMRAERVMLDADLSRKTRAKHRDRMAAQFILQGYLDQTKSGRG